MPISNLTEEQIKLFVKESTCWKELMTKCGYTNYGCRFYIKKRLDFYNIDISHFVCNKSHKRYTNDEIFKDNSEYSSMVCVKNKLIKEFNWEYRCSNCKLSEWMGNKIPLEVDHINGIHTDNRIENLRFLCPNCHALTDTYKGKNIKNKEHSKVVYANIGKNKICKKCNMEKHKYSEVCIKCHLKDKVHKNSTHNKKINSCIDCSKVIHKDSERCIECYKKAKKKGIFIKNKKNTNNMIKCCDCENLISRKSKRCRVCHYILMKSKSKIDSKEHTKGKCIDCNNCIDVKATRCLPCSKKLIENADNLIKHKCIDCNNEIWNTATRCVTCHTVKSRKVVRPTYEQLLEDKKSLNMVQIGKKYGVSDNSVRKWLKYYEK